MSVRGESEFLNLPFKEKLEFLYGLPARQKRDLILSAPEAERLVQSFSPETLFYTLKEIGIADAGDLLSLALPEQVRSLFDLDCWDKDRPNLDADARMDRGADRGRTPPARRRADGARPGTGLAAAAQLHQGASRRRSEYRGRRARQPPAAVRRALPDRVHPPRSDHAAAHRISSKRFSSATTSTTPA